MRPAVAALLFAVSCLLFYWGAERAMRRPSDADESPIARKLFVRESAPYTVFGHCVGPLPDHDKPPGEFRVFLAGGSTVAIGDPPLPVVLEQVLRRNGYANVRVYNCGVASQNSSQELVRLLFEIVDLEPDLVVDYDGGNDVMDPYYWDPRPGYPMDFVAYERNPLLLGDMGRYPTIPLLLMSSRFLRDHCQSYFVERLTGMSELRRRAEYGSQAWRDRIADVYVDRQRKAATIARAFGAKFIAFFQPILFYKARWSPPEADLNRDPYAPLHAWAARELVRRRLREPGAPPVVDLSEIFDRMPPGAKVYADYIHLRQEFQHVAAEALFRGLVARGLLPRPTRPPAKSGARTASAAAGVPARGRPTTRRSPARADARR